MQLIARHGSPCLTGTSAAVQQRTCSTTAAQRWKVTASGACLTLTGSGGECLDMSNGSTADSAEIITCACHGAANQLFPQGGCQRRPASGRTGGRTLHDGGRSRPPPAPGCPRTAGPDGWTCASP